MAATFLTPTKKAFIKGIPKPEDKVNQLTALQKAGATAFGYRNQDDTPIKVELDVITRLSATEQHIIAEFPIEDGTFLSDNVVKSPEEVEIEAIITDTPTNIINPLGGILDTYKGRSSDVVSDLRKIKDNNITVTIVTDSRIYKDMLLRSFTERIDNNTGFAINVSMGFKKRRTVRQQGAVATTKVTDDVRNTVGVGDALGLLTLLPLVV
jgi:hypothetical protein